MFSEGGLVWWNGLGKPFSLNSLHPHVPFPRRLTRVVCGLRFSPTGNSLWHLPSRLRLARQKEMSLQIGLEARHFALSLQGSSQKIFSQGNELVPCL
jgi:hypothetical protein